MTNIPRNEYPRPRMVRAEWMNLNGSWAFQPDPSASGMERRLWQCAEFTRSILVPFAPESRLSGIGETDFLRMAWYRRSFMTPAHWGDGRILLHFGAVDYAANVWVNGTHAGEHKGGYTPFFFDVTDLLHHGKENVIVVSAYDDTKDPLQPSGKQSSAYANEGCMYTRSTGIWQTVWLEHVPALYIQDIHMIPDVDNRILHCAVRLNKNAEGLPLRAEATFADQKIAMVTAVASTDRVQFSIPIPRLHLWAPGQPNLYDLTLHIGDDLVRTYFGMRKISIQGNAVLINDRVLFQRLILDQGYYPDGIYTAPSADAIRRDITLAMAAGFNGARLHMKVFEPYMSYYADHMGYLLWGEYPSWGANDSSPALLSSLLPEWVEALQRDRNSPAIIGWCPFNETSPHRNADLLRTVYRITKLLDPTRPVIDTSGHVHTDTDIFDVHDYDQNPETFRARYAVLEDGTAPYVQYPDKEQYAGQPYFVSEFGGTVWSPDTGNDGWGYGERPQSCEEFYARFRGLVDALLDNAKISGFCYTQLTDVMQEKNGLYTFDRRAKFDGERLRKIVSRQAEIER